MLVTDKLGSPKITRVPGRSRRYIALRTTPTIWKHPKEAQYRTTTLPAHQDMLLPIDMLSTELWLEVLSFLDVMDVVNLSAVRWSLGFDSLMLSRTPPDLQDSL